MSFKPVGFPTQKTVYPDVDNDADDFFNFGGSKTSKSRTQTSNKNQQSPARKGDNSVSGT